MNKAELQADIASRALSVLIDAEVEESYGNVTKYRSNVLEQGQGKDRAITRNIGWYVMDEGQPGEVAYYRDDESPNPTEAQALADYIDTIRGPGKTYAEVEITNTNRQEKYAEARCYTAITGGNTTLEYILINFVGGSFQHSVITNWSSG